MNAVALTNLLLEDDPPSPASRTGVYIFGPRLPNGGFPAENLDVAMQQLEHAGFLPPETLKKYSALSVMNSLIRSGYTFVTKTDNKDVQVIGRLPIRVPEEEKDAALHYLGLDKKTVISYQAHPTDNKRMLNADQVLYGTRETEPEQNKQAEPAAQKQAEPAAQKQVEVSTVVKGLKYIKKGSDWFRVRPDGSLFLVPASKSNVDTLEKSLAKASDPQAQADAEDMGTPLDADPAQSQQRSIGIDFDDSAGDGLTVVNARPGEPAALAGVQAGDKFVGVLPFTDAKGKKRPGYLIHKRLHIYNVIQAARAGQMLTFKVQRGDRVLTMPMKPRELNQLQPPRTDVEQATGQVAPRRERREQWRQSWKGQPNEPVQSRQSGNLPANVSSLT